VTLCFPFFVQLPFGTMAVTTAFIAIVCSISALEHWIIPQCVTHSTVCLFSAMDGMYCHQGAETKGEESSGVIQMIDNPVNNVEKENQVMKLEEKDAQDDYEKSMADAKDKRAADSKSMSNAEGTLAETDEQMVTDKGALKNKNNTELLETDKYLSGVHADCDWLLKYYDMRKEARTGEIDASRAHASTDNPYCSEDRCHPTGRAHRQCCGRAGCKVR